MTEYLAEQMRSLTRRLEELAQATMPDTGLEGSLNAKQLAELLGVGNLQTFTRSMNKIRSGDADKLTRMEMTELAEAFVRLLAAEAEDTQKAMQALKRVSAKAEPVMEDVVDMDLAKIHKFLKGTALTKLGADDPVKAQELSKKLDQIGTAPTWKSITSAVLDYRSPTGEVKGMHDELNYDMYGIIDKAEKNKLIPKGTLNKMMDTAKTHTMRGYEIRP